MRAIQVKLYPNVKFNDTHTKLILPNIGKVRCRGYRDLEGEIKQCVVKVNNNGTITATVIVANKNHVAANNNWDSIGIDVGTRKFLTDSNGNKILPSGEVFKCVSCNHTADADHNAAINICNIGYTIRHLEQRIA